MSEVVQMPNKTALPVLAAEQPPDNVKLGPKVLMSGYMTKRTRTMNMWKQRWWQLKADGILHYYNPEGNSQKILGEIDVGKTCYDVKMGSDTRIKFPRAVPSCCCFSFAVLKRVFYVYTPTPDETRKWVKAISEVSRVINRKIVAGLERRKAPEIPGGNAEFRVTRIKAKGSGPGLADSFQDISKVQYIPLERNRLALMSKRELAGSLPDYLDKVGLDEENSSIGSRGKSTGTVGYKRHDSLQLQKQQLEELQQKQEKLRARAFNLQSFSMENIASPRSQRKPIPTPRKERENFSKNDSVENDQLVTDSADESTRSEIPEVEDAQSSLHRMDKNIKSCHSVHSRKSNISLPLPFSPPSSPPPLPPKGKFEFIPPPPLSSPPHSHPRLSISGELQDGHFKKEKESSFPLRYFRTDKEEAPISSPPVQRARSVIVQSDHTIEKPLYPRAAREIPKFIVPPPPPAQSIQQE